MKETVPAGHSLFCKKTSFPANLFWDAVSVWMKAFKEK